MKNTTIYNGSTNLVYIHLRTSLKWFLLRANNLQITEICKNKKSVISASTPRPIACAICANCRLTADKHPLNQEIFVVNTAFETDTTIADTSLWNQTQTVGTPSPNQKTTRWDRLSIGDYPHRKNTFEIEDHADEEEQAEKGKKTKAEACLSFSLSLSKCVCGCCTLKTDFFRFPFSSRDFEVLCKKFGRIWLGIDDFGGKSWV